jgi:dipeptidyl aminopeptidase/acylaminoacyl peptidase
LSLAADALVYSQTSQRNILAWIAFDPVHLTVSGVPEAAGGEHALSNFSFSPDGSKLVVDTLGEATENLWIMNPDGSGRRRLTSDAYKNRSPAWSPNGDEILFFSDRSGNYESWLIRPDGSGLRPLTTNSHPYMQKAIWSPDGGRILAGRSPGAPVMLDARAVRPVSNPQPAPGLQDEEILFNSWSAGDGDGVAIGDLQTGPSAPEIVLYPLTGRLEHTHLTGGLAVWLRGGTPSDAPHRYFLFARGGDCLLYDRTLKRQSRLFSVAPDRFYYVAPAPDGRRIYFTRTTRDADLWLARLK